MIMILASFTLALLAIPVASAETHDYLYSVDSISFTVRTLDMQNNKPGPTIEGFYEPGVITATPDGKYVYVSDNNGINIIDTDSISVTGQIPGTEGTKVSDMKVSGDAKRLFAANKTSPVVHVYSIGSYEKLFDISLSPSDLPRAIEVSRDGKYLYVAQGSGIVRYDIESRAATGEANTGGVSSMVLDSNGTYLYVVNAGTDKSPVHFIKTEDMSETATVNAGANATAICILPSGKYLYTANHDDLTVTVISTKDRKVTRSVNTGIYPHRIIAASDSSAVYVATETHYLNRLGAEDMIASSIQNTYPIQYMAMARKGATLYTPPATPTPLPATPTPTPEPATLTPTPEATLIPTEAPVTEVPTVIPATPTSTPVPGNKLCFGALIPLAGIMIAIGPVTDVIRRRRMK